MNRTTWSRGLALLIVALVAADWASKLWITNRLALNETWSVIEGLLYFVHRQNPGVAFSMFADMPADFRVPVLTLVSLVGVVLFASIIRSTPDRLARIGAAAVIAGAIGNMGDRVLTGQVTDFVFLAFFPFVFNVADAAITLGGSLLATRMAFARDETASATAGAT